MRYLEETFGEDGDSYGGFHSEMSWASSSHSGLPCFVYIECGENQPRWNNPRIKFGADKRQKTSGENPLVERIPMMICDEPHIPEGFEHIKHNLTDEELDVLKEWVRKNKELLLDLGDGRKEMCDYNFWEQAWRPDYDSN